MDGSIGASRDAYTGPDGDFVDRAFREILRRPADEESRTRALGMLADGTLSRATFLHELVTAPEAARVRELDDAVALGLGARARGERLAWLQAPAGTDERVVEIPWALSRLVPSGRVVEVGYAYAEPVYLAGLLRAGVELVGVDLAESDVEGMERISADVRSLPLPDDSVDQVLLISTLEHVGADNTGYGLDAEDDPTARVAAMRELRRVLRSVGSLLVTVPLGEPGDHGWFRLDDVAGWTTLFTSADFFVEEQEAYELTGEGWRAAPSFDPHGVGYGDRGPAASAVLCTELSPGRFRRLATPGGLTRTMKRRTRALRHRG
jgi:SAM-dependent methyltransferase